jgi:putative oxidoreductase
MSKGSTSCRTWPLLPLRLVVGFGFTVHGLAKLRRGPEAFASILGGLHVPMPHVMAWATALIELVGGLAVMVGAWVTFWCVPLGITMLVALLTVHLRFGFSSVKLQAVTSSGPQFGAPGYEMNLLYLVAMLALALSPTMPFSVDNWIKTRKARG